MNAIDAASETPVEILIERAGAAVAARARQVLGGVYGRRVIVIAGPGNNGADGRVAGRRLAEAGMAVTIYRWDDAPAVLPPSDLVIDAAFGTGFRGEWTMPDTAGAPILAVDVPTGLDALTGNASPGTAAARATVTFAAAKPGHVLGAGPDLVGELDLVDIGLDLNRPDDGTDPIEIVEAADVAAWLPARSRTAHKWSHAVRVIAGSPGMDGAAWLACAAAQRAGAGIVVVSSPGHQVAAPLESVVRPLTPGNEGAEVLADLDRFHSLVIGPGLGRVGGDELVASIIRHASIPILVDGDGLNALATSGLGDILAQRRAPTVLTPHDGEYERLTGSRPSDDRIADLRRWSIQTGAVILLKGPTTVIADPSGRVRLVDHGDQALATAGSGDVLSGIIGALLARSLDPADAAAAGAWIHAEAGHRHGAAGLIASDLIDALPAALGGLV
ncbi:MAG: NAD(P)H-hydrate dehydratase [Ilumatobacter coccineus]|uniref:ADP-dependent (S)-NAD(P)H-hydrate dehydratase n=1 Tax=Ilumatobacter coccineus TaxID=467094 RepID=A0A2G6K8E6_9ACTN|nr:MAG: NAD(P)H-hydrate dehydratase [Ilumatobacter coccineus]